MTPLTLIVPVIKTFPVANIVTGVFPAFGVKTSVAPDATVTVV
jgi:hypothetical protein